MIFTVPIPWRRPAIADQRRSILAHMDFHPTFNLPEKTGKWIFSRRYRKITLAHEVERPRVILKFGRKFLIQVISSLVERKIEFGNRPIRTTALFYVKIQGTLAV